MNSLDFLSETQKEQVQRHLLNAWNFLNLICEKIKDLEPSEYFAPENDDYRASLDIKIQNLMEEIVVIKNNSKPLKENGMQNDRMPSIYIALYPEVPLKHVNSFRTIFAHIYKHIQYSRIWRFMNDDLWKFYNFAIDEANVLFDKNDDDPVVQELISAKKLDDNEEVFKIGNVSEFSGLGDNSDEELENQSEIIAEWERRHKKIKTPLSHPQNFH